MQETLLAARWNYRTAAHLLARAGFGGPPAQVQLLADLGLEKAVAHLVDYEKIPAASAAPTWAKPDPDRQKQLAALRAATPAERMERLRAQQQDQREHILDLRRWWLERMANSPRPLEEKLTLFWHGHFATSVVKVRDAYLMWRQNETFRRLADGHWLDLLVAVSKDPAMLIWLDQAQSRKQHPNENYARELMELFTLGEGHYTEKDVLEAARAWTGWSYDRRRQEFTARPLLHDTGVKTFLGLTGNLNGMDILERILAQPQAARFITAKLWHFFAGSNAADDWVSDWSAEFHRTGYHFKPLLRRMFLSEEFYSAAIMGQQIKSPVQWLVGTVRLLERELPPAPMLTNMLRQLGQELFAPPNVKGWDDGISWITTNTLLDRYNLAALLIPGGKAAREKAGPPAIPRDHLPGDPLDGHNHPPGPIDVKRWVAESDCGYVGSLVEALTRRFLLVPLATHHEAALREYCNAQKNLDDRCVLKATQLILSTPEYQLT